MKNHLSVERKLMGGRFLISGWEEQNQEAKKALFLQALDYAQKLELMLTDFHESEFNQINKYAGIKKVVVSPEIMEVIQLSLAYSQKSAGAFDISYASVGHLWRAARKKQQMPNPLEITQARAFIDYKKIDVDPEQMTVFLPEKQMRIGLGGIGKGFIIDKVFDFLREKRCENFMVNGSGDVRVHSAVHAPRPWRFGLQNPFDPSKEKKIGWLTLSHGSVSTSGDYVHFIKEDQHKHHHILDPQTGQAKIDLSSVTVLADTAVETDTQATIMMILGKNKALDYANEHHLKAILVDTEGHVFLSQTAYQIFQEKRNENLVA